jgi:hypothetical protein
MKYFIIYYKNGKKVKAKAKTSLELVRKYDLASKKNLGCRIMEIASC